MRSPASIALADAGVAGRWRGGPATTGTAPDTSDRPTAVTAALAGGCCCCAWPLPADATCAAVARGVFREVAATLSLPEELAADGLLMTSELAANTLHAHGNIEFDGAGAWPIAGTPELWIYLRRAAGRWELVVKVFDSVSGWKVPGKAVWFAQPVPGGVVPERLRRTRLAPGRAARALEEMLVERGLGGGLLRAQEPSEGMSVLSVRYGLTVWCRDHTIWWRSPDGRQSEQVPTDLVEIAEQIVCACAEMDCGIRALY